MAGRLFAVVVLLALCSGVAHAMPLTNRSSLQASANVDYPTNYYGVDVSQPVSVDDFKCLKADNLQFAVVRCYQSVGQVDPNCASTCANANEAGMHVDAYMFPCPRCGNPSGQVRTLLSYFETHGVAVKRLWLDIEGPQYWTGSVGDNQAFYKGLVSEAKALGLVMGVYSSASQWSGIFGRSWCDGTSGSWPLWYADYDGVPTFGDFESFGCWSSPSVKQFSDAGSKCGTGYDINWTPALDF